MKRITTLFRSLAQTVALAALTCSTDAAENVSENDSTVTLDNGVGLEFVLEKTGFRYGFRQKGGEFMVPVHPTAGLLAGPPDQLSPAQATKYLGKVEELHAFEVTLADARKIKVHLDFGQDSARFELINTGDEAISMALRSGGVSPGYGLGDVLTNWWQRRGAQRNNFQTEITGFESYDFNSSNGYASRMVSNFAIYPVNRFGVVNIDPSSKIVVSKDDEIIQGSRQTQKMDALYYFFGTPAEIYAGFLKARNTHGFPVMKPSYDMYGVGWEAWGALAWNTSQETVMADIDRYLEEGYPLKWAVVGSGFWPHQEERFGATTSFGMWDEKKYPDPDQIKKDFKDRGLRFLVGLRIAFLHDGPFTSQAVDKEFFIMEKGQGDWLEDG